ncbi:MAG: WD40 repeat domain-containing protein [Promethearchaeota archaeon]
MELLEVITIGKDVHKNDVFCLAVHPEGKIVASGSSDMNICLWDITTGEFVKTLLPEESEE